MQKKNPKTRCERRTIDKAEGVCRFYSKIQSVYADQLEENDDIEEIHCNVLLEGLSIGVNIQLTSFVKRMTVHTWYVNVFRGSR